MKYSCVIIDDEPLAREIIAEYIDKSGLLKLTRSFNNGKKAVEFIRSTSPDILFLDINMPGRNGLEMLESLAKKPLTILTTAYRDYALEAYELGVIDYLVKPIRYARFIKSVDRCIEFLGSKKLEMNGSTNENASTISFKSGTKQIVIPLDAISHIQGLKDYSIFYTKEKKYIINGSIKHVLQNLPAEQFMRVHKSFIIAKKNIVSIQHNRIEFDDFQIPIGRVYRPDLDNYLGVKSNPE